MNAVAFILVAIAFWSLGVAATYAIFRERLARCEAEAYNRGKADGLLDKAEALHARILDWAESGEDAWMPGNRV